MAVTQYPYGRLVPVGSLVLFAGTTAPAGWLICDGTSLVRTDYPSLFETIGTAFGSVDGTHFTLPDMRDRMPVGTSGTKAIATTGGSANAIVVTHNHDMNIIPTGSEAGGHGSPIDAGFVDRVMVSKTPTGNNTDDTGSSGTGANLPPYLSLNYIIKAVS